MAYGDELERDLTELLQTWAQIQYRREGWEMRLHPDERLDALGWEIFYCATARGMDPDVAAELALNGNLRQRRRVAKDMWHRHAVSIQQLVDQYRPAGVHFNVQESRAVDQLAFWRGHAEASFVYFIQDGEEGPVKIGLSKSPEQRLPKLQTGNPRELFLRHVIPGDLKIERGLHTRFAQARIRREWFGGPEYLPIILAFASGLSEEMIDAYDGSGTPLLVTGGTVRTEAEIRRIRRDIEQRWLHGFTSIKTLADLLWLDSDEIEQHLIAMSRLTIWDIPEHVGSDLQDEQEWRTRLRESGLVPEPIFIPRP
jgi:hypothetical protein